LLQQKFCGGVFLPSDGAAQRRALGRAAALINVGAFVEQALQFTNVPRLGGIVELGVALILLFAPFRTAAEQQNHQQSNFAALEH
jgi:hypothetical protein